MSRRSISVGPGAASLILVVVIVSMSVLGMLSLYSASSELGLARRAAEVVQTTYTLNEMADETAKNAVSDGETGNYAWQETKDNAVLQCEIEIKDGGYTYLTHTLDISGAFEDEYGID